MVDDPGRRDDWTIVGLGCGQVMVTRDAEWEWSMSDRQFDSCCWTIHPRCSDDVPCPPHPALAILQSTT